MAQAKKKVTKKKTTKKTTTKKKVAEKSETPGDAAHLRALIEEKREIPDKIRAQMGGVSPAADRMAKQIRQAQAALDCNHSADINRYCELLVRMTYNG